jgi:membrane associated rhomboid family serine protease
MAIFEYLTITLLIILFTVLVSYQGFTNYHMVDRWKHYPYRESRSKEWYRILTSGFVHADWIHSLVNMYVLYSFGGYIESTFRLGWVMQAAGWFSSGLFAQYYPGEYSNHVSPN